MRIHKGLLKFFSGNIFVQLIALVIMPIVTRLYNPSELGVYQFITTIALIVSPFVTLSLNEAIVKQVDIVKRNNIFYIAVVLSLSSSFCFSFFLYISSKLVPLDIELMLIHYACFFLVLFTSGFYSITQSLNLSTNNYGNFTTSSVIQSLTGNISKLILGLNSGSSVNLLFSIIIGSIIAIFFNVKSYFNFRQLNKPFKTVLNEVRSNKNFTLYFSFSVFISILVNWHIVLFAPLFADAYEVGILALAIMITRTPMHPFLNSISSYCYAELVKIKNVNGDFKSFFYFIILVGALISVSSSFVFYFYGGEIIYLIFGEQWVDSSIYAIWLSISMIPAFILYPIYYSLANLNNCQKFVLYVDYFVVFSSVIVVFYCLNYSLSLKYFVMYSSLILFVSHVIKFFIVLFKSMHMFEKRI